MKPSRQFPGLSKGKATRIACLFALSTLVFFINAKCSQPNEPIPDNFLKATLKPGEVYRTKVNDVIYNISYSDTQIKFSEGVVEAGVAHQYRLGEVKLVVNNEPIQVRAEAHYDNKGGRQPRTWTYLRDSQGTATIGQLTIGVANFYPVSDDLSSSNGYAIDLLIQPQ